MEEHAKGKWVTPDEARAAYRTAQTAEDVRPPGPEFVPPIGDEPGVWIFWPAPEPARNDGSGAE